jgi:hypothetical protein
LREMCSKAINFPREGHRSLPNLQIPKMPGLHPSIRAFTNAMDKSTEVMFDSPLRFSLGVCSPSARLRRFAVALLPLSFPSSSLYAPSSLGVRSPFRSSQCSRIFHAV